MAITFTQEKKKQKYLMIVLVLVVLLTLFFVWWGFFKGGGGGERALFAPDFTPQRVNIDFKTLTQEELGELKPFPEIPGFEGDAGRDNPFLPY